MPEGQARQGPQQQQQQQGAGYGQQQQVAGAGQLPGWACSGDSGSNGNVCATLPQDNNRPPANGPSGSAAAAASASAATAQADHVEELTLSQLLQGSGAAATSSSHAGEKRPRPQPSDATNVHAIHACVQACTPTKPLAAGLQRSPVHGGSGKKAYRQAGFAGAEGMGIVSGKSTAPAAPSFTALQQAALMQQLQAHLVQQRGVPAPQKIPANAGAAIKAASKANAGVLVVSHPDDVAALVGFLKQQRTFSFTLEFSARVHASSANACSSDLVLPMPLHAGKQPPMLLSALAPDGCEASGLDGVAFSIAEGSAYWVPLSVPDSAWGCAVWQQVTSLLLDKNATKVC